MYSLCETCEHGDTCANSTENPKSTEHYDGTIVSVCPEYTRPTNTTPYNDREDFGADNVTPSYAEDWD